MYAFIVSILSQFIIFWTILQNSVEGHFLHIIIDFSLFRKLIQVLFAVSQTIVLFAYKGVYAVYMVYVLKNSWRLSEKWERDPSTQVLFIGLQI